MANYEGYAKTSKFRVTDEEKLRELVAKMNNTDSDCDSDDEPDVKLNTEGDGLFYLTGYESIFQYVDDDGDMVDIFDELQGILPEGEVVVFQEVGHEKFNLSAYAIIVTKDKIIDVNLEQEIRKQLEANGLTANM